MESVAVVGVLLGVFAVVGGALLEGLQLSAIFQPTAAIIVFGGTIGATLVSFPREDILSAIRSLREIFGSAALDVREAIEEVVRVAVVARKEGILAVDQIRESIRDPLFKKSIKYVIDGFDPQTVKEIMQAEIDRALEEEEAAAKVWEAAGGYAPTVGILGAVLGLIHVMQNLSDPSHIGSGIAVAFVATVYGVASANLFFIPFGTKLKRRAQLKALSKEVVRLGVSSIQEGLNPNFLREKLEVYLDERSRVRAEGIVGEESKG